MDDGVEVGDAFDEPMTGRMTPRSKLALFEPPIRVVNTTDERIAERVPRTARHFRFGPIVDDVECAFSLLVVDTQPRFRVTAAIATVRTPQLSTALAFFWTVAYGVYRVEPEPRYAASLGTAAGELGFDSTVRRIFASKRPTNEGGSRKQSSVLGSKKEC
jgi:hypothetical protein